MDKLREDIVISLLGFGLLKRELYFACCFAHKQEVDDCIICCSIEVVLDVDEFEFIVQCFIFIQNMQRFHDSNETALVAFEFGSQQVANVEDYQVDVVYMFSFVLLCDFEELACQKKVVNEY